MIETLARLRDALAGAYAVERQIGRGGMATVYLAKDIRHDRAVAIKVLHPELTTGIGVERFLREIRTTAGLTHPRILPMLDSGEADGLLYYTMPYVDGESLRDRLDRESSLTIPDALHITLQIADALAYAHSRGIVHRDIKPENILFSASDLLWVSDFGLARALHAGLSESLTASGLAVGSPRYISPEQAAGERHIDGRSDIYSLACIAFEMCAGVPPFPGESLHALIAQHIAQQPPALAATRPDAPRHVSEALAKAMSKVPGERFASASEFAQALDPHAGSASYSRPFALPITTRLRRMSRTARTTTMIGVAVMFGLLAAAVVQGRWRSPGTPTASSAPIRSLVVLPLDNLSGNPNEEYFSDGMTDALITELARYDQLRVISRTSAMQYRNARKSLPEIATELGVDGVVEGTVMRDGQRIRITAQLIRAATDEHLWAQSYERDLRDILSLQSEIAEAIAREVHVAAMAQEPAVARRVDPVAHALYLRGRYAAVKRSRLGLDQAVKYYREAIEVDPEFALVYAGLADAYTLLGAGGYFPPDVASDSAESAALRAIELDASLSEAHTSQAMIMANRGDVRAADQAFRTAIRLQPGNALAHHWYALLLALLGRHEAAIEMIERAQTLDPLSPSLVGAAGQIELVAGNRQAAIKRFREAIQLEPVAPWPHHSLGFLYLAEGNCAESLVQMQRVIELASGHPRSQTGLSAHHALCGDRARAESLLAQVTKRPDSVTHAMPIAIAYAALGDKNSAFAWLERAHWNLAARVNLLGWPILDELRTDRRYDALLRKIKVPGS